MSVLIKGMEMPKNCAVCQLERDIFGRAVCFGYEDGRALYKDDLPPVGTEIRRPSWCPLVEIPPHGRLIDADALDDAFTDLRWEKGDYRSGVLMHWGDRPNWCLKGNEVENLINAAPTIIEAEESE